MSNPDILTPKLTAAPVRFEIGHTHTPISGEHGGKSECAPRAHAPAPAHPAVLSCSAAQQALQAQGRDGGWFENSTGNQW